MTMAVPNVVEAPRLTAGRQKMEIQPRRCECSGMPASFYNLCARGRKNPSRCQKDGTREQFSDKIFIGIIRSASGSVRSRDEIEELGQSDWAKLAARVKWNCHEYIGSLVMMSWLSWMKLLYVRFASVYLSQRCWRAGAFLKQITKRVLRRKENKGLWTKWSFSFLVQCNPGRQDMSGLTSLLSIG